MIAILPKWFVLFRPASGTYRVSTFVDDLRLSDAPGAFDAPEQDKLVLTEKLFQFKQVCEAMGLVIHEKPGKLIWPTQKFEWIGWSIDSVVMMVRMTVSKSMKSAALCEHLPKAKDLMSF